MQSSVANTISTLKSEIILKSSQENHKCLHVRERKRKKEKEKDKGHTKLLHNSVFHIKILIKYEFVIHPLVILGP